LNAARGFKDVAALKTDNWLDAVREREDFQQLLAILEGRAAKASQ
jgi:hypothetical protein